MRNPLNRRIRRDIKKEWKKYIVLFLRMTLMIATGSGIFVANDSMLKAVNDYADNTLLSIDDSLYKALSDVRRIRQGISNAQNKKD